LSSPLRRVQGLLTKIADPAASHRNCGYGASAFTLKVSSPGSVGFNKNDMLNRRSSLLRESDVAADLPPPAVPASMNPESAFTTSPLTASRTKVLVFQCTGNRGELPGFNEETEAGAGNSTRVNCIPRGSPL
jgi:hypothetical protein